ncbi:hypothetical protein [Streptomyces sp. NPDC048639]|uniref:hypothetical protein n=1 Tax=Streptomyces sp. NPDC048639 TaxID=3365581 RepID=UPI003713E98D
MSTTLARGISSTAVAGALALGILAGTAACTALTGAESGGAAASPPGKPKDPASLDLRHRQQVKLVRSALGSKSVAFPSEAVDLGFTAGAMQERPFGAVYSRHIEPGQSVEVDVACVGHGRVTLRMASGEHARTTSVPCPRGRPQTVPVTFEAKDGSVRAEVSATGEDGAMGVAVRALHELGPDEAEERALAARARAVLPPLRGGSSSSEAAFVPSDQGGIAEELSDPESTRYTAHVACVGSGAVTISSTSGDTRHHRRIPCTSQPRRYDFPFTRTGSPTRFELDSADRKTTATAVYVLDRHR